MGEDVEGAGDRWCERMTGAEAADKLSLLEASDHVLMLGAQLVGSQRPVAV